MGAIFNKKGLGVLPAAGLFLSFGPVQAAEEQTVKPSVSGSLRGTYDYRALGSEDDHDTYGYWYVRGRNLADRHVEVYTSGRVHADMDGSGSGYDDDPFIGLDDTANGDVRMLQFYVDIHDVKDEKALRIGRQYVDVADYIQMDGIQAMLFENRRIGGRVFLGQPVSEYSSVNGDLFLGASLTGRPWQGNRSRATYARYQDDSESAADDHFYFDVNQQVYEALRARGYLSVMNEQVRMGGGDLFFMSMTDYVFDLSAGVRRWDDYDAETRAYSPLVEVLGDQEPYTIGYGRMTAQLVPTVYLSPGAMTRRPDDSDATNREFDRYDLSLIYEPSRAFSSSVAVEFWDVEQGNEFFALSGDVRYRHEDKWEVSAGAAYVDYTYFVLPDFSLTADGGDTTVGDDGTRVEASPDAYTYYLRGKWNLTEKTALRVAGEIEDDSDADDLGYRLRTSIEVRL